MVLEVVGARVVGRPVAHPAEVPRVDRRVGDPGDPGDPGEPVRKKKETLRIYDV